jgi:tRNA threonylcarbamoyladenosine biosynthesis protein TsaE
MIFFKIHSLSELNKVASEILELLNNQKIIAFYGSMGSGKTTVIKEICKLLGCTVNITSPTFALVNEYPLHTNQTIFHFDFYRLQKSDELINIGFDEYIYSGHYCFIEWPEIAESYLPDNTFKIKITECEDNSREFSILK